MNKYLLIFLASVFILAGCVSELDFFQDREAKSFYVVEGVISNSTEGRIIRIGHQSTLDTSSVKISATGAVFKDEQFEIDLIAQNPGELHFPTSFQLEEGASYHVEITTADNQVFKTNPQIIQPRWQTDSMSFELVRRLDGVNAGGGPKYEWYTDIYAHIKVPLENEGTRFLRTQMDEVWSVHEVQNGADPFNDIIRTCYLRDEVTDNPSRIISTENFTPGSSIPVRTGINVLNSSFLYKHYFNVYLHSVSQEAFEFYSQAERLIDNTGSIYDEIPAPLQGNVFNADQNGKDVFGFVDFSQADTFRLAIRNDDIGRTIANFCVDLEFPCITVNTPGNPPPPCVCFDCHLIYGFQSLYKPLYWED